MCILSRCWDFIILWDAISCARLYTFMSPDAESVALSPDGARIVSGTGKTLWLWDTISGGHPNTLRGHSEQVASVAFSPDGMVIVSGSDDHTLRLWDAVSLPVLPDEPTGPHLNARSPDSQQSSWLQNAVGHFAPRKVGLPIGYIMDSDGWLCSLNPKRRICWIPVSCRTKSLASSGNLIGLGKRNGRVVFIDLAGLDSYLQPC
jgi:WD40 repeat protein